jgi:hypothetical protein
MSPPADERRLSLWRPAVIDLETLFAQYCFQVSMLQRSLEAERSAALYLERANHLLRQLVSQMRIVSELPREEAEGILGELLSFDHDMAVDLVVNALGQHRQCLRRLESDCLASESDSPRYDLTGPNCLEVVATSHQVLDYARGVLWAVKTFGLVD